MTIWERIMYIIAKFGWFMWHWAAYVIQLLFLTLAILIMITTAMIFCYAVLKVFFWLFLGFVGIGLFGAILYVLDTLEKFEERLDKE